MHTIIRHIVSKSKFHTDQGKNNHMKPNEILVAEIQLALAFRRIPNGFNVVQGIVENLDGEELLQAFSGGVCSNTFLFYQQNAPNFFSQLVNPRTGVAETKASLVYFHVYF